MFTLYPHTLDSARTRQEGRKYSKACCVAAPKFTEVKAALDRLKVAYKAEATKRHPRAVMAGRFIVGEDGDVPRPARNSPREVCGEAGGACDTNASQDSATPTPNTSQARLQLIQKVTTEITEQRERQKGLQKIPNALNLTVARKKKGKRK